MLTEDRKSQGVTEDVFLRCLSQNDFLGLCPVIGVAQAPPLTEDPPHPLSPQPWFL